MTTHATNIIQADMPVMLTLTFNNHMQHAINTVKHRLNKVNEYYTDRIKPSLNKIFVVYEVSLELSEPLASDGKHFPRLHYHVLGIIKDPIEYHLHMGLLFMKYDIGYHTTLIKTPKQHELYKKYIRKQRKQWDSSQYNHFTYCKS